MLSLVIPTLNEAANIGPLLASLRAAVGEIPHEFIVVDDDSKDRTWEVVEQLAKEHSDVRVIRRIGRRGLSSAVTEGFAAAKGDVLMVMDADGQHDPSLIRGLYDAVIADSDLAVASRYVKGGGTHGWDERRLLLSKIATFLARTLPAVRVTDPMSGFFTISQETYKRIESRLHPRGFKILLEILGHLPPDARVTELPLVFGLRTHGESKMTARVQLQFLRQLVGIAWRRFTRGRLQWIACAVIAMGIIASSALRVVSILPLYVNSAVRSQVQSAVQNLSDRQGILLSEFTIQRITDGAIEIAVRRHHRGHDERDTFTLPQ